MDSESFDLAIGWLLRSKIHNVDEGKPETFGSFNNFYDLSLKRCKYAYTEITAYGIELLLDLYEITGNSWYLENAKIAGDWVLKMQYTGEDGDSLGAFSLGYLLPNGPELSRAYSFDAGICVGALVELYKKTGNRRYLEAAVRGAKWLVSFAQNSDGSLKPFYDRQTKSFGSAEKEWYILKGIGIRRTWFERPGCHHGKSVIGILKLHSVTQDDELGALARKLCEWTMSQLDESGYFRVSPGSKSVFTHTHCYAIEGLLYAYEYLGDHRFLSSALKATHWLIETQESCGVLCDWVHDGKRSRSVDCSSIAQMARILFLLESMGEGGPWFNAYQKAVGSMRKMQCIKTKDLNAIGGFYLLEVDLGWLKFRLPRLYSWPTMFAISALTFPYSGKGVNALRLW